MGRGAFSDNSVISQSDPEKKVVKEGENCER